jgi:hypothetical protein
MKAISSRKLWGNRGADPALTRLCKDLKTEAPLTLYRTDSLEPFFNADTPDGSDVGTIMLDAISTGNADDALRILNSGVTVKYNNHIGTSVSKTTNAITSHQIGISGRAVKWEISAPAGTEGAYLESLMFSGTPYEGEFLLQSGTTLKITGAEYKDGVFYLKAKAVQEQSVEPTIS